MHVSCCVQLHHNPHLTEPFSPPGDTHLVAVMPCSLKFGWSAVADACTSLLYEINTDCGICITITNLTDISCSINVHDLPKVCSFRVRSIVCGNITGMWSNPVNMTMKGKMNLITGQIIIILQIFNVLCSSRANNHRCCSSSLYLRWEFEGRDD